MKTCFSAVAALLAVAGLLAASPAISLVGSVGSHKPATTGVAPQLTPANVVSPNATPVPGCLSCNPPGVL